MTQSPSLRVVFLGSGSAGNATAVSLGETLILFDCGFSAREVGSRLRSAGLEPGNVSAIFVTHEHSDHVRGIEVFVRRHAPGCIVHGTTGTLRASGLDDAQLDTRVLMPGAATRVDGIDVVAFRTSHDASEPVGYRVQAAGAAFGLATDTGVLTSEALEALSGVDVLGMEGNHDVHMLERGPYPAHLKRRILSTRGHLSNEDGARALERLASNRLTRVVTLHRSRTNNTASLAETAFRRQLERMGLDVPVHVAEQDVVLDTSPPQVARSGG